MFTQPGSAKEGGLAALASTDPSDTAKFQAAMLISH